MSRDGAFRSGDLELFAAGGRPAVSPVAVAWARFVEYWRFARLRPGYLPYPDGRFAKPWSVRHSAAAAASVLPLIFLAPLAWRGRSGVERRVLNALTVLLLTHCLLHVASHARARYRMPVEALWAIPAAAAIVPRVRVGAEIAK